MGAHASRVAAPCVGTVSKHVVTGVSARLVNSVMLPAVLPMLPMLDLGDLQPSENGGGGNFGAAMRARLIGGRSGLGPDQDDDSMTSSDEPLPLEVARFIATGSGVRWLIDVMKGAAPVCLRRAGAPRRCCPRALQHLVRGACVRGGSSPTRRTLESGALPAGPRAAQRRQQQRPRTALPPPPRAPTPHPARHPDWPGLLNDARDRIEDTIGGTSATIVQAPKHLNTFVVGEYKKLVRSEMGERAAPRRVCGAFVARCGGVCTRDGGLSGGGFGNGMVEGAGAVTGVRRARLGTWGKSSAGGRRRRRAALASVIVPRTGPPAEAASGLCPLPPSPSRQAADQPRARRRGRDC